MEKAGALVNVRDINLICRAYKTSARIEGVALSRDWIDCIANQAERRLFRKWIHPGPIRIRDQQHV